MNNTFKTLTLTAVFLSFSVSTHAESEMKTLISELNNPAKAAEIKALAAADGEATKILLNEAVRTDTDSQSRCAAIKALGASNDRSVAKALAAIVTDPDLKVQACAVRAAGESRNEFAAEALISDIENYLAYGAAKGPYEVNLKARIKAINSIWSLGEIGSPTVTEKLLKFFADSDDVVKINIAVSAGKTKSEYTKKFLYALASDTKEASVVRAAAYEMLSANKAPTPASAPEASASDGVEKGDIIYTGGTLGIPQDWLFDMPVGHAGIFGGTEVRNGKLGVVIYDCVPDSFKPYGGVRKIYSWADFTHNNSYPFYGNRISKVGPNAVQRKLIIKAAIAKLGHHYSDSHFSQKGPEYFDCVGFTEYVYESAGLNPTPDDQESGWGWPLTPAEQFAATTPNTRAPGSIIIPAVNGSAAAPQQGIISQNLRGLMNTYGMTGQFTLPEVNMNIQTKAID